jgi:hypothetical protein
MPLNYSHSATLLHIDGIDFTDYSVRGLTMTLTPLASGNELVRNVDGGLMDWSASQFRKLSSKISCADFDPPPLLDVWVGKAVTVHCIPGLAADSGGTGHLLQTNGTLILNMMVSGWNTSRADWDATTTWELDLEEI